MGKSKRSRNKPVDSRMIDFLESESATIGFYSSPNQRSGSSGRWVVVTKESECSRKTLREAIYEAMQDHGVI